MTFTILYDYTDPGEIETPHGTYKYILWELKTNDGKMVSTDGIGNRFEQLSKNWLCKEYLSHTFAAFTTLLIEDNEQRN